jgi:hypothetical protein
MVNFGRGGILLSRCTIKSIMIQYVIQYDIVGARKIPKRREPLFVFALSLTLTCGSFSFKEAKEIVSPLCACLLYDLCFLLI